MDLASNENNSPLRNGTNSNKSRGDSVLNMRSEFAEDEQESTEEKAFLRSDFSSSDSVFTNHEAGSLNNLVVDTPLEEEEELDENGESLSHFSWRRAKVSIGAAMKKNLLPGIILNIVAIVILVGYYNVPFITDFLNHLGEMKTEYGIRYSFISTAIFGGFFPFLFVLFTGPPKCRTFRWVAIRFPWFIIYWGIRGIELDYFYRFQSMMFGNNNEWLTILYKTLVDELIYAPFFTSIYVSVSSLLEMNDFAMKKTFKQTVLSRKWWINTWCVINIAAWMVWVPISIIIYILPSALQTTLLNIVVVFWVLFVRLLAASKDDEKKTMADDSLDAPLLATEI